MLLRNKCTEERKKNARKECRKCVYVMLTSSSSSLSLNDRSAHKKLFLVGWGVENRSWMIKCLFRMLFFVLENWTHKFTHFNTTEPYVMVLAFLRCCCCCSCCYIKFLFSFFHISASLLNPLFFSFLPCILVHCPNGLLAWAIIIYFICYELVSIQFLDISCVSCSLKK